MNSLNEEYTVVNYDGEWIYVKKSKADFFEKIDCNIILTLNKNIRISNLKNLVFPLFIFMFCLIIQTATVSAKPIPKKSETYSEGRIIHAKGFSYVYHGFTIHKNGIEFFLDKNGELKTKDELIAKRKQEEKKISEANKRKEKELTLTISTKQKPSEIKKTEKMLLKIFADLDKKKSDKEVKINIKIIDGNKNIKKEKK
jgi:hypothetical protein